MNNIMFIIRAGFIRYSAVRALEVIRCNSFKFNIDYKTSITSNNFKCAHYSICVIVISLLLLLYYRTMRRAYFHFFEIL